MSNLLLHYIHLFLGQGNGTGPQIGAVASKTPVLHYLRSEGCGVAFRTSISGDVIRFVSYAFVDDTDIEPLEGDRSRNSFWYLIDFVWTEGNWSYASEEESRASISVRDFTGQRQVLDRLSPSEARRTLGVRLAPDGNETAEFN
jgi:hypothetical protein